MFEFHQDFKIKGKWALPEQIEENGKAIFGILSYTKSSGLKLVLEGSLFNTPSITRAQHYFILPILCGKTEDLKQITLYNLGGNELGTNDWIYTDFDVEYAICCKSHYFGVADLGIYKFNFSLNCFPSFLDDVMGRLNWKNQDENSVTFSYTQPPAIDLIKNANLEVYFFFSYGFKGLATTEEFNFTNRGFINYEFTNAIGIAEAIKRVRFYKDFFSFFSYRKVSFHKINIYAKNEEGNLIEFALLSKDQSSEVGEITAPYDILLDYKDLEDIFPQMLQTWINNQELIDSGLALFMQTKYLRLPSPILSFLNLVFAVETLHNTYFQSKQIKYFSERLKDLIQRSSNLIEHFIYDVDDFCRRVKGQRNFLAHDHSKAAKIAIPDEHYPYFISTLKMIFECTFLKILNLDSARVELYLKRHYTYQKNKEKVQELRKGFLQNDLATDFNHDS